MADNITLSTNIGSGSVIAAQDEGSVFYQEIKLVASGSGTVENLTKAEDTAHTTGEHGIMSLAVRNDTLAALATTDGDYSALQVSATGALYVEADLGSNNDVTIDGSSIVLAEDAVHGSGDAGIMPLAVRNDTLAALAGTDGDYAPLQVSATGALYVTGGGGGTQYAISDILGATDTVTLAGVVRDDSLTTLTEADGDVSVLRVNSTGALHVTGGGGGTQYAISDVLGGTDTVTLAGVVRDDSLTTLTEADGDVSVLRVSSTGQLHVTGGGGGTQYNIDTALGATDTTTLAGVVRDDTLTTLTEADGDISVLRVSSTGALHVTGGGGGTQYTEDTAHTTADVGTMTLGVRNDVLAALGTTDGDYAPFQVNATGALYVDGSGFTQPVSGTVTANPASGTIDTVTTVTTVSSLGAGTTGPQKAEDAASAAGDVGVPSMAVRKATAGNTSGSDGDYEFLQMDSGRLWVSATIDSALPAGTAEIGKLAAGVATIGEVTIGAASTAAGDLAKAEDAIHTTGDVGVMALAVRQDAQADFGADGDYVPLSVDAAGAVRVSGGGGGTQYAIDTALGATDTTTLAGVVRDDALTTLTEADGDISVLRVSSTGALHVTGGGGGTERTDDTDTHTATSDVGTAIMAVATPTDGSVDVNDYGHLSMSVDRRLLVDTQLVGQDADINIADGGNNISVDWAGSVPPIGAGTEAAALRVTLATDSTGVVSVDDGGGNLSVDWGGTAPPIGAGTEATALRVTVATDSTGVVSIDDNGGAITVDNGGTFAVQSTLQTGANTIGEVTIGAATTAAGDLAKAEDVAHTTGDVGVMSLAVRDTSPAATSGTDGDYEPIHVSDDGGVWTSAVATHQGGNSSFSSIDLDETEEDVATGPCTVSYMYFWNATAAPLWVQLFNTNTVTVGTTTPDLNFPIPANADSDVGGVIIPVPQGGIQFSTALSVAVTTASGTTAGAPGANEAGGVIVYKD